jgi:uncharacterized protein
MRTKLLAEQGGLRTYALVFGTDEEAAGGILDFAVEESVTGATLTGIGAFRWVRLGYFDLDTKDYEPIEIDEQVEVLTLAGNLALTEDGTHKLHAHTVVGKADGSAHGGHLLEAVVRPTLEIVAIETPAHLRRYHDPATGLPLLRSE